MCGAWCVCVCVWWVWVGGNQFWYLYTDFHSALLLHTFVEQHSSRRLQGQRSGKKKNMNLDATPTVAPCMYACRYVERWPISFRCRINHCPHKIPCAFKSHLKLRIAFFSAINGFQMLLKHVRLVCKVKLWLVMCQFILTHHIYDHSLSFFKYCRTALVRLYRTWLFTTSCHTEKRSEWLANLEPTLSWLWLHWLPPSI